MNIDLKHADLLILVLGTTPKYGGMDDRLYMFGLFTPEWEWDPEEIYHRTEEELWEIYQLCKQSWE